MVSSLERKVPELSHSLHTKDGETIRLFVANEVQKSNRSDVVCQTMLITRKDSEVVFMQFYREKSRSSLRATGLKFYLFHITLQNFVEEYRLKQICHSFCLYTY